MSWQNVQYENGKFRTSSGGGGGSSTLAGLDDVAITSVQNSDILIYNGSLSKWKNQSGLPYVPEIYSTAEREVGVWTNGKPIYQKTYSGTTNNQVETINVSSDNIDELVDIEVSNKANDGTRSGIYYAGSNDMTRAWVDGSGSNLNMQVGSTYPSRPIAYKITLFYTKNSD